MDLGNGLIIHLVVYLVVEVFSSGKESVTLLPLNMVVRTVMDHDEKVVSAIKANVQVTQIFFSIFVTYITWSVNPFIYLEIMVSIVKLK